MSKEMNCNKLYCVTTRSFHLISYEAKWTCVKSRFLLFVRQKPIQSYLHCWNGFMGCKNELQKRVGLLVFLKLMIPICQNRRILLAIIFANLLFDIHIQRAKANTNQFILFFNIRHTNSALYKFLASPISSIVQLIAKFCLSF